MNLNNDPKEVVEQLLKRSTCSVQVAALLVDREGIFSWSWNHQGFDGLGEHAEAGAIRRGNWKRYKGATLYVAARRGRNGRVLNSKPCEDCALLIKVAKVGRVVYRDREGWVIL